MYSVAKFIFASSKCIVIFFSPSSNPLQMIRGLSRNCYLQNNAWVALFGAACVHDNVPHSTQHMIYDR